MRRTQHNKTWMLFPGALTLTTALAVTPACGPADEEADDLSWVDEMPLVALATACTFSTTAPTSGTATITLADTGETVLVSRRSVDSAILVNGFPCGTATATTLKKLNITGGAGNDTVIIDYLNGTFGAGTATAAGIIVDMGTSGTDAFKLRGTTGADTLTWGAGTAGVVAVNFAADNFKDITVANADTYAVATGAGIDTVTGAGGANTGAAFTSTLTINGGAGADILTGGDGNDTISGGDGNDTIRGGAGDDTLNGDAENDTFDEGASTNGGDIFNGGAGTDTVSYATRTVALTVLIEAAGADTQGDGASGESDDIIDDCEVVTGGTAADTMTCQAGGCTLNGGLGIDTLTGAAGVDTLNGDGGNDILTGKGGADVMSGGDGDDTFDEEDATTGGDTMNGGTGTDTVDYSARTADLTVTMDGVAPDDGLASEQDNVKGDVENILGGTGNDTITGNALANVITGGLGNDTLSGGAGEDIFSEEAAANGNDTFNGGDGVDTVDYSLRTADLTVTMDGVAANDGDGAATPAETDNVKDDVENLLGGDGDDTITGNLRDNNIDGGAGADSISGGLGNDILDGGADTGDSADGGGGDGDICIAETATTCEL